LFNPKVTDEETQNKIRVSAFSCQFAKAINAVLLTEGLKTVVCAVLFCDFDPYRCPLFGEWLYKASSIASA
jgi:hypothetical protein